MKLTTAKFTLGIFGIAVIAMASCFGTIFGIRYLDSNDNFNLPNDTPIVLNADSAARGEQLSLATGSIDRDRGVEGLFVLDHLSGNIQCWVVNPRDGSIAGVFTGNVNRDLELGKAGDADFVMTCGSIRVEGRRGNEIPAGCICYVGDGNSGRVVGYSLLYDKQLVLNNGTQEGELQVIARGFAREANMKRDN